MSKIQGGPPKIQQSQPMQGVQQAGVNNTQQETTSTQMPQTFEPAQSVLANQVLPQTNAQTPSGTIKAGLLGRGSLQVGHLMNHARQAMDKLGQQINWRTGRMMGQLRDFFKPRAADQRPPIQAMYGVIMPGIGDGGGIDLNPGQRPPINVERPPIQAMYGVIMPGIGGGGGVDLNPGQKPPSNVEPPPIQAMYGVIMPGIGGGDFEPPAIQPMYGVTMPPQDWRPVIQPKYGVIRPPMMQAGNVQQK